MEFRIDFGPDPDEMSIVTSGTCTLEGFKKMIDEGIGDPRWQSPMRALLDYTDLDMSGLSADHIRAISEHASTYPAALLGARVAVLAPRALAYGLARMAASTTDVPQIDVRVFGMRDDAEAWLRLPR
jgi:hypothetical protein